MRSADAMYADALASLKSTDSVGGTSEWHLRSGDGSLICLTPELRRWCGQLDDADRHLVGRCVGPVLDVGCGPGRFVSAVAGAGGLVLGIDVVEAAVRLARVSGAAVLHRSVFDRLPAEGRWGSVLLVDGNIGIGGDPVRLLKRCRHLARPGGRVLVELGRPDGRVRRTQLRLESAGIHSGWFDWAIVAADAVDRVAVAAGLAVTERWHRDGRWFAALTG